MGSAQRNTWQQVVAAVQRMPDLSRVSMGEILDAVRVAAVDIGNMAWPWNYAEANVLVPAPYSTGTVSTVDGTATVTGLGTLWSAYANKYGWRMRFGNNNLDYIVNSFNSDTSITLAQPLNLGSNLSASSYTLYQDTFFYPADYILGSDVGLYQPVIRTRIPKIPRSRFEAAMNAGLRSFSTNITMFYCDQGTAVNPVDQTKYFAFRLAPPPSGAAELRLCYHSIANCFTVNLNGTTDLPDGFDDVIILVATSKLYDAMMKPGSSGPVKALAEGKLKLLRRQILTQTIDDVPDANIEIPDSSISQWGMTISRM
jgi:hypothetical protein